MKLYYIYFLPNEPKVGFTGYNGSKIRQRILQNKWKPLSHNIDGWVIIGAALSEKEARQMEREYQARYNCLDNMNNPQVVSKVVAKTTGQKRPEEFGKMLSDKLSGRTLAPEHIEASKAGNRKRYELYGYPEAARQKAKNNAKLKEAKEIIQCPHCNKQGGLPSMTRWHLDNCKHKL